MELIGEEAEAMGHSVERLDDLNTRSYHMTALELITNRREKLLGRNNPTGEEERSMWLILAGMVATTCPSSTKVVGEEAEGDEQGQGERNNSEDLLTCYSCW